MNSLLHVCKHLPFETEVFAMYPLAGYAARNWWRHMQKVNPENAFRALDLAEKLLKDGLFGRLQLFDIDKDEWISDFQLSPADLSTPL